MQWFVDLEFGKTLEYIEKILENDLVTCFLKKRKKKEHINKFKKIYINF
jgi:hypothetical protein